MPTRRVTSNGTAFRGWGGSSLALRGEGRRGLDRGGIIPLSGQASPRRLMKAGARKGGQVRKLNFKDLRVEAGLKTSPRGNPHGCQKRKGGGSRIGGSERRMNSRGSAPFNIRKK